MRHRARELRISLPSFLRIFVCARSAIFLAARSPSALPLGRHVYFRPFAATLFREPKFPSGIRVVSPKSYSATSNLIASIYARITNTATICQMFNCSNVRQYICSIVAILDGIAAFVCVYKFTRCLRDTYTLFTQPTSNLESERVYGF